MAKAVATYLTSTDPDSKSSTASGTKFSAGTEETVQFMMVNSLISESYESWLQHRCGFLQRGIYHAYMQHTHGKRSSSNQPTALKPDSSAIATSSTSGKDDLLPIIQPMLVYTGLIEQLQRFFKVKKAANQGDKATASGGPDKVEDDSGGLEDWEVVRKEKLLNVRETVGCSKELFSQLDEMTSTEDLQEAFDIIGVLSDVLSGGFTKCEDFVNAAISSGRN